MSASVWYGPLYSSPKSPCISPWSVVKITSVRSAHPRAATAARTRPQASSISSFITWVLALISRIWSSVSFEGTKLAGPPSMFGNEPSQ